MRKAEHPDAQEMALTSVLAALADPVRMQLVQKLADGREMAWSELDVPVGKSTLSYHLKTLRSAGVTRTRQEGTRCFVRLRMDDLEDRFPGVLPSILGAVDAPTPLEKQHADRDAGDDQPACEVDGDSGHAA